MVLPCTISQAAALKHSQSCSFIQRLPPLRCRDLGSRSIDRSGHGTALNVDSRKVKVLVGITVPRAWELQDAQVPVCAVGRRGRRLRRHQLRERRAAFGVPEANRVLGEVL